MFDKEVRYRKLFLSFIFAILFFSFLPMFASANAIESANVTLVIDQLRNDNILNGNSVINVSLSAAQEQNWTYAIAYIQSAGSTANNSLILINGTNNKNVTTDGTKYNISITIPSLSVEDGNDYTLTVSLWNGTAHFNKTASVTVDNSIPTAPTSLLPTSDSDGTVNFSATVVGKNTTACTLYFSSYNPGATSYAMSHSGDSCSVQLSNVAEQTYPWYITASDGTNTTNSNSQTTSVDVKTSAGKAAQYIASGEAVAEGGATFSVAGNGVFDNPITGWVIGILVFAGIIITVLFVVFKKK